MPASWAPRDPDQSSSPLGQWVHDKLGKNFYAADVDLVCYAKSTKILRIFESKHPGQRLKPSQRDLLPMFASWVARSVSLDKLSPHSGVFVVWFDEERERVEQIRQVGPFGVLSGPLEIGGELADDSPLGRFFSCRSGIPPIQEKAA